MKLSENAKFILSQRYLLKDENGDIIETPIQLFKRVAKTIAAIELNYGKSKQEVKKLEREFFKMMTNFEFLPNSPTLMNAGTDLGQLSACFVLPVEDDTKSIFQAIMNTALIHKSGGGTGFSFSRLRPREDIVKSTGGIASGPISFMTVFDAATETIKQGGKRRGANMGVMRVDHPDVMDFIVAKEKEGLLRNFNLSVGITDKFMQAVQNDSDFHLVNPRTKRTVKIVKARTIWNLLTLMSWKNGEPAVVFLDRINANNPTPQIGEIEATNPCGEQPLLPYESCNLGSINLSKFYKKSNGGIDFPKLEKIVKLAIRFLDDIIDANKFPLDEIKEATLANRKIGLGVMGWADLLIQLGIRYDSNEALKMADDIMQFIHSIGFITSQELGKERGNFPNFEGSIYSNGEKKLTVPHLRNATITTIAPTGTISLIAGCSSGIEPIFAIVQTRNVKESLGKDLTEVNPAVKRSLELKGLWTSELEQALIKSQCLSCITAIPNNLKKAVVTSHEISPEWHIKMQAIFQKYSDNAVSKTINLPYEASIYDIEKIYLTAYQTGCKGITLYRDGSRKNQLLIKTVRCEECES